MLKVVLLKIAQKYLAEAALEFIIVELLKLLVKSTESKADDELLKIMTEALEK